MAKNRIYKITLKQVIATYKKRKLKHPVACAKAYMRGYNDVKRIRQGLKPLGPIKRFK
tara:strand:+ start:327 stop:500 length:174 start_codon:yes stop_codon:yes gene_type:complete